MFYTGYGLDGLMLGGALANVVMAGSYLSIYRRLQECPIERHARRTASPAPDHRSDPACATNEKEH